MSTYVISGDLRRRLIKIPDHFLVSKVRPTSSVTRSTLFNIILHNELFSNLDFTTLKVADLFCGSGIVGIEFLSLGAEKCTFFDKDLPLLKVLRKNLDSLGINNEKTELTVLSLPAKINNKFDVIFLDPPYKNTSFIAQQIEYLVNADSINDNGFVILECNSRYTPPEFLNLSLVMERKISGNTKLLFWQYVKPQESIE